MRALLQLGLLLDGTGRRDQAKPIYEQILKIQPDQAIALTNLATDDAIAAMRKRYPNLPWPAMER